MATPKISVPLVLMVAYVAAVVFGLYAALLWDWSLFSETLFWFVGTALVLFARYDHVVEDPHFFRHTMLGALSLTVIVEFLTNLSSFSLPVEFLLVPLLVLLGATLAVSATREEFAPARGCLTRVVAVAGLGLLLYSLTRVLENIGDVATTDMLRELVTPALLTLCLLPFIYLLGVYGSYDGLLSRLKWLASDDRVVCRYARRRVLRSAGLRLRTVVRFVNAPWLVMAGRPPTRADVDHVIEHVKSRTTNALAMSRASRERIEQLKREQPPGWEYMLFAMRLEASLPAIGHHEATAREGTRRFERPFDGRRAMQHVQRDNQEAVQLVEDLDRIFEESEVLLAFGAPGEPGDAERILGLAERLILLHGRMLCWSSRARSSRTCDQYADLVQLHASLLDKPNQQVADYIDRWVALGDELPQLIEGSLTGEDKVALDMSLVISVDNDLLSRLNAEAERLRGKAA
ncbi:MAG: hypothetical protein WD271_04305 [Acidimicrobiia bacterium]